MFNLWIAERFIFSLFYDKTMQEFIYELKSLPKEKRILIAMAMRNRRLGNIFYKCLVSESFKLLWLLMHVFFIKRK